MPTSSQVSRIAAWASEGSEGSRFPPGSAMCEVQRSPLRAARLMKRSSGVEWEVQGWLKNWSKFEGLGEEGDGQWE